MKNKVLNKVIASLIIMVLTVSYWGLLAETAYAALEELETQKAQTNNKNVEFDAYFKTNEKTHSQTLLQSVEGKLYVNLSVKEGYLKEGTISIDNPNFVVSENPLNLDQIEGEKEIEIPFTFEKQEEISLDYLSKESDVILKAIYIDKNGKEKEVSGTIKIHLTWTENVVAKVEQQVEKVIDLGSGRTLVQVSVKDYIENNSVPAESINLKIDALKLDNTEIESVDVYATKTILSNGTENGTSFSKDNWQYNGEEGKIIINVENKKSEDGKISWKDGEDEFKIVYILKSTNTLENAVVTLHTEGEIKYNENSVAFEETKDASLIMSGSLINFTYTITDGINKGYMYAKTEETGYETRQVVEISYSDLVEYIDIEMGKDRFVDEAGNRIETNGTIYKRTKINKVSFDSLFGEEGRIEVYGNGEKVGEITKDSVADEEGNVVIEYGEEVGEVLIKTSKPIAEGKIEIINEKAVKGELGYSREEIQRLKVIETESKVRTNITEEEKTVTMELRETVSKAEISMLTEKVSTVIENERVEIQVLLRTDSNAYDLYKNPYLEIELPIEVKEVEVESIAAAFGEGFQINWTDVIETEEGKKVIRIALIGEQERYAIDISEGMSIVIRTKMTLDKKSGSKEEVVKLRYRNENAIGYENNGEAEGKIEIEAPTGVVAVNSIEGYNEEGEKATSLSSKEEVGELEILTEKKTAKVSIDVINNYEGEIENPRILGRVPAEGNKKVTGEELGSTFTANMVEGIEKTEGLEGIGYKIYYSSNGEATEDKEKEENGWKETIEEAGEVKSYLIETEGYKMGQGESMSFEYEVEIPEGLNHNESSYSTYAVDYEVEEEGSKRVERVIAPTVGATTGEGPELEVSLESNVANNGEVQEGQIIKYNVKIDNVGNVPAKNVEVVGEIPSNTVQVKLAQAGEEEYFGSEDFYLEYAGIREYTETIAEIPAGETYTSSYEVKVGKLSDEPEGEVDEGVEPEINNKIVSKAKITAEDLGKEIETNEYISTIADETITLSLEATFNDNIILKAGDRIKFSGNVVNRSSENKENAVIVYNIPNGLNIEEVKFYKGSDDISDRISMNDGKINFNIGTFEAYTNTSLSIIARVKDFEENEYERTMVSRLELDGKYSNEIINYAAAPNISINYTSNRDKYIGTNSEIEYYIEIANSGKAQARNVLISDALPEELSLVEFRVSIDGQEDKSYVSNEVEIDIPAESTARITIVAKVKDTAEDGKEISNAPKISGDNIKTQELTPITHTISSNKEYTDPDTGEKITTYSISGTAWEDTNKDGKKDINENKLSNIEVILIDNSTGEIAKKVTTNAEQKVTTNTNGEYKFDDVKAGEYIVAFLYDGNQYDVTEFKKAGVLESENSDAVKTSIKFNNEDRTAGITEVFEVKESSVSGINIGLIKMESAIFSINKVVTRMSMTDPKTSKTVDFDDSKLAKMDADGKYINSTNFVIEYKLSVTNEGSVAGYVKKIVDNVPSQFKFSTDSNPNWYLGNNGEVYNTSLANTIINPGETKEVTLVLTKKMSETGDGIVHNTAEITEVYNEYGLENIIKQDTTKQAADVIIGIKTGREIIYISLIFVIIGLIGLGIYVINKKVFNKVIDKKLKYLKDDEI